jgi:hypothetical protein
MAHIERETLAKKEKEKKEKKKREEKREEKSNFYVNK